MSRPEQVSPGSIGVFVESDTWQRLMTLLALIRLQYRTEVGTDTSEMPDALARTIAWKEAAYDEELGIRVHQAVRDLHTAFPNANDLAMELEREMLLYVASRAKHGGW